MHTSEENTCAYVLTYNKKENDDMKYGKITKGLVICLMLVAVMLSGCTGDDVKSTTDAVDVKPVVIDAPKTEDTGTNVPEKALFSTTDKTTANDTTPTEVKQDAPNNIIASRGGSSRGSSSSSVTVQDTPEFGYPVTIKTYNYAGDEISTTYKKAPSKVLAVYQGSIETMLALGLGDKIVAAAGLDNDVAPELMADFKKLNYLSEFTPAKETVVGIEPDMILSWSSYFGEKTLGDVDYWIGNDCNTYINSNTRRGTPSHYRTLENEYTDILNIGRIFNVEDKAKAIVDSMKAEVAKAAAQSAKMENKPRVLVLEPIKGTITNYGEKSLAGDMVSKLGGVIAEPELTKISKEGIIAANPDKIFVVYMPRGNPQEVMDSQMALIKGDPALASVKAIQNNEVHLIMLGDMYASGIRTKDGIHNFAKGMYPELYDTHYPVTIKTYNYAGDEISTTYKKAPSKVLAVYQGSIETMLALGLGDKIVAAAGLDNDVAPELMADFKKLNYLSEFTPAKETVVGIEPDMILSWSSYFGEKTLGDVDYWIGNDCNTYINSNTRRGTPSHYRTLENEYTDILNIGRIFNVEDKAKAIVDSMKAEVAKAAAQSAKMENKPRVLVLEPIKGTITNYGEKSLAGDMVSKLGGVIAEPELTKISKEGIIAANPDKIFVVYMPRGNPQEVMDSQMALIKEDPALASVKAIQNNEVHLIMLGDMYASGIRTKDGIHNFAKGMYPELYK